MSLLEVNILDKKWYSLTPSPEKFAFNIIGSALKKLGINYYRPNISIALAGDDLLHHLNLRFRKINRPTNVLAFQYERLSSECFLGDIAISIDRIQKESDKYHLSILAHAAHMLVHGLLHLLSYDHKNGNDRILMKRIEKKILSSLEI